MLVAAAQELCFGLMNEPFQSPAPPARETRAELLASIVARMSRGEQEAMSELYDETSSLLNGLLVRMLGRAEDAEEVLMDVYMRAWKKASSFSTHRGSVQSWLVIMARSMAIDRIRQRKTQADTPVFELETLGELVSGDASPETQTEDARRRRMVAAVLNELPREQREVLELAFFCGFTHSELATRLGQPLGTVKSRIRMALGKVRALLEQQTGGISRGARA